MNFYAKFISYSLIFFAHAAPIHNSTETEAGLYKRIFGGFEADSFFAKSVIILQTSKSLCGGTIISPRHVITAGHCLVNDDYSVEPGKKITVKYNDVESKKQLKAKGIKSFVHPKYNVNKKLNTFYDIALVEMTELDSGDNWDRVPIFDKLVTPGQYMLALGWGQIGYNMGLSQFLKGAIMKTSNAKDCKKVFPENDGNDGPAICSLGVDTPTNGVCGGDSGSGSFLNDNGVFKIAGITTLIRGSGNGLSCGTPDLKYMFARIGYFMDFVLESTGLSRDYLTGATNTM